jgi:hypothetical protein
MAGITVAVVLFGASLVPFVRGAAADQIGATRAQITGVESAITAGAAHLHQLTLSFDQANVAAINLAQQVGADQSQIARLQAAAQRSQSVLRRDALLSYTGAANNPPVTPTGSADPAIRSEYLQIATGDINEAVDAYQTNQRLLASSEANLVVQERQSQAAAAKAEAARQDALTTAALEQAQLDHLQSQLNQLVTAAAVAAARAAAAQAHAQAEAQAQAAARQAAQQAAQSHTQGLPVNNGLVRTVQNEVAPAPAPAQPSPSPSPQPAPSQPAPTPSQGGAVSGGVWLQLRTCESGDNYAENTGNGFYGAYQFSQQTWNGLGLSGLPSSAPPAVQDQAAMRLQAEDGWAPWPACSAALGLAG